MPLYEVAVVEMPTKKAVEEGVGVEKLIVPPTPVIASDERSAAVIAMMEQKELKRNSVLTIPTLHQTL